MSIRGPADSETLCRRVQLHYSTYRYRMSWMSQSIAQSQGAPSSMVLVVGRRGARLVSRRPSRHRCLPCVVPRLRGSTLSAQPCLAALRDASCTCRDASSIDVFVCGHRETISLRSDVVASIVRTYGWRIRSYMTCQVSMNSRSHSALALHLRVDLRVH